MITLAILATIHAAATLAVAVESGVKKALPLWWVTMVLALTVAALEVHHGGWP
jgi:hypothetical protein